MCPKLFLSPIVHIHDSGFGFSRLAMIFDYQGSIKLDSHGLVRFSLDGSRIHDGSLRQH